MEDDKKRKEARSLLEASSIGWMFPIALALGYFWGRGMDKWLGTYPWLTVIFTFFGIVAAFVNLFRLAKDD
jgi:F0F1-type ATP synthase assembly protein I